MSKFNIVTPVLIESDSTLLKLIYINFSSDGSIYVLLPRKRGYRVVRESDIPEIKGKVKVILRPTLKNIASPYLSFHPRKNSIHINTLDGREYKFDTGVINMAEDKRIIAFPLCQIVIPKFTYFDTYKKKKYSHPFIIKTKSLNPKTALCLEIWIHPKESYIDPQDIPLFEARKRMTRIIGVSKFQSSQLRLFTCTLIISEIQSEIKDKTEPGITVAVFNKKQPYAFVLHPLD